MIQELLRFLRFIHPGADGRQTVIDEMRLDLRYQKAGFHLFFRFGEFDDLLIIPLDLTGHIVYVIGESPDLITSPDKIRKRCRKLFPVLVLFVGADPFLKHQSGPDGA